MRPLNCLQLNLLDDLLKFTEQQIDYNSVEGLLRYQLLTTPFQKNNINVCLWKFDKMSNHCHELLPGELGKGLKWLVFKRMSWSDILNDWMRNCIPEGMKSPRRFQHVLHLKVSQDCNQGWSWSSWSLLVIGDGNVSPNHLVVWHYLIIKN